MLLSVYNKNTCETGWLRVLSVYVLYVPLVAIS